MKPWRQACIDALKGRSEADAIRFWRTAHHVDGGVRPIFDYRFEHTVAAVKIGLWLARKTGADPEIVECAAWLHDFRKILQDPLGKDTHAQDAAEALPEILEGTDFPPEKIQAVQHAILHHVGLRLTRPIEPLEAACLWDADKLSKIGAASLVHHGCISGAFQPIDTGTILERGETWLKLAAGIVESMNTEPGREEARKRLEFITRHYRQLRREWGEPMEESEP
jgi:uncharacterized protein